MKNKYKRILTASTFFTIYVIVLNVLAIAVTSLTKYFGIENFNIVLSPIFIIFPPIIPFYYIFRDKEMKNSFQDTFALNKIPIKSSFDFVFIGFSGYILVTIIASAIVSLLPPQPAILTYNNIVDNTPFLLIIIGFVFLAPIMEEVVFRGLLFKILENQTWQCRIIFSSFLFAVFHFDIYNFIPPFFLGIILAYIREKTKSIYPAIIIHVVCNLTGVLLMSKFSFIIDSKVILGVIVVVSLIIFGYYLNKYNFFKYNKETKVVTLNFKQLDEPVCNIKKESVLGFLPLIIPVSFYVVLSVFVLIYAYNL